MTARIAAFLVWAAVAAAAVFWGLRVLVAPTPMPPAAQPVSSAALRGDIARLFSDPATPTEAGAPSEPALASRFKLIGVMAPPAERRAETGKGIALIAVDGKPPRAYRVGARLDEALVLQSVAPRAATIGPPNGAAAVQLDLPPLPAAATGSLPPAPDLSGGNPVPSSMRPVLVPSPATQPQRPGMPPGSAEPGLEGVPQPGAGGVNDPANRR
jgi:general secretion pathway protein C